MDHLIKWHDTVQVTDEPWAEEYAEHLESASREGFKPLTYTEYVAAVRRAFAVVDTFMEKTYGVK